MILLILLAVVGGLLVFPAFWATFYFAWKPTAAAPVRLDESLDEPSTD